MRDQSSSDPTNDEEFAIEVYRIDRTICIDIEWIDVQTPERVILKLTSDETRQLIDSLTEHLTPSDAE